MALGRVDLVRFFKDITSYLLRRSTYQINDLPYPTYYLNSYYHNNSLPYPLYYPVSYFPILFRTYIFFES